MFILLNEPSVQPNQSNPPIVSKAKYNPLDDDNISGITTNSGNWIKKKAFIVDFLNLKKNFKSKSFFKNQTFSDTIYSMPGDVPIEMNYHENIVKYYNNLIDIASEAWGGGGGTDSAFFELNVNIPWLDIKSWIKANYDYNKSSGKIKAIYLVPEIQLINPPLNSAFIQFNDVKINNKEISNYNYQNTLVIPNKMQESEWKGSDVLGILLKILGYSTAIAGFAPGSSLISTLSLGGLQATLSSEIANLAEKKGENYIYTNKEENRIKIASNINLEEGEDLNISIPTIEVKGKRNNGYWWDRTIATLTNLYVVLELE